ncbi:hypothetical protein [Luteibaculum oceani]|uniref:Uncharacterized protein n=1 Tax=Luteibaculum oceani TaxID=1294296 RepID=A0A5C6VA93_9FLAO|nr:hypothetical protein [Luteibaculum oceani]TXC81391.1 hypothetical protein FRX97_05135 [Luteibaculum oceani]
MRKTKDYRNGFGQRVSQSRFLSSLRSVRNDNFVAWLNPPHMLSRYTHAWAWPLDNRLKPTAVISKESLNIQAQEIILFGRLRNPVNTTATSTFDNL